MASLPEPHVDGGKGDDFNATPDWKRPLKIHKPEGVMPDGVGGGGGILKDVFDNLVGVLQAASGTWRLAVNSALFNPDNDTPLAIDEANRLEVAVLPAKAPSGSTAVSIQEFGPVIGTSFVDNVYVIPAGETLTVTRFVAASEGTGKANKVELFYDPTGTGTGMTTLRTIYTSDNTFEYLFEETFVGDGTATIRARRTRLDSATREIFMHWNGFLQ